VKPLAKDKKPLAEDKKPLAKDKKPLAEDAKQIVCIMPKGMGRNLVEALSQEYGIYDANFSHARGVGRSRQIQNRGLGEQREKDVFSVVVESAQADELFEFLFYKAGLDEPHTGMIYMQAAPQAAMMELPEITSP
tara:strand:+ start:6623 stop:7027 length:405 start_codon:yes stop_codon:yes gene_type:complete